MPTNHREQLADLLKQTTFDYVDHQEDDLLKPVLESETYLAGMDYIVRLLSVAVYRQAALEYSPSLVIDTLRPMSSNGTEINAICLPFLIFAGIVGIAQWT
jgi:hypothetical protein